jgi:hypothetical protein
MPRLCAKPSPRLFIHGSAALDHFGDSPEWQRTKETTMNRFSKIALGAVMLAGATTMIATAPAQAQVSVGIGYGSPVYGGGYGAVSPYCDPYSRWYDRYRCESSYGYYDQGYYADPGYGGSYYGRSFNLGGYGGYRRGNGESYAGARGESDRGHGGNRQSYRGAGEDRGHTSTGGGQNGGHGGGFAGGHTGGHHR